MTDIIAQPDWRASGDVITEDALRLSSQRHQDLLGDHQERSYLLNMRGVIHNVNILALGENGRLDAPRLTVAHNQARYVTSAYLIGRPVEIAQFIVLSDWQFDLPGVDLTVEAVGFYTAFGHRDALQYGPGSTQDYAALSTFLRVMAPGNEVMHAADDARTIDADKDFLAFIGGMAAGSDYSD